MKKYNIGLLLFIFCLQAKNSRYVSHSYYETAPLTFLKNTHLYNAVSSNKRRTTTVEVGLSAFSSYNSEQLARYFSPFDKEELVVKEDVTAGNPFVDKGAQDILSYNFNLVTQTGTYESKLKFAPSKHVVSSDVMIYKQLNDRFWVHVIVPFRYVKTDMHLEETIKDDGGGVSGDLADFKIAGVSQVATMKQAFALSALQYGKIDGSRSSTGFADITIKVGKDYYAKNESGYVRPFVGLVLPASNKATAKYMFEPIRGNGQHAGLIFGSEYGKDISYHLGYTVTFEGVMQLTYLVPNHQFRSFDPGGKPWGRYLAVFANDSDKTALRYSFGINQLTHYVKVNPGMCAQYNANILFHFHKGSLKFGYQTTVRASENVGLPDNWTAPAIASIANPEAQVNPARGINTLLDAYKDGGYYGIQRHELNTAMAQHPFYVAHHMMASYIKDYKRNNKNFKLECGGYISFGTTNAVPHEWGITCALACSL